MAATSEEWILGTQIPAIAGSALSALANNALVLGSAINNLQGGGGGGGDTLCRVVLNYEFAVAPAANTGISVWFLKNTDGSTGSAFEDGGTSVTPARSPDVVFPVVADTNPHSVARDVLLPSGFSKPLLKNDGTGQAFATSTTLSNLLITPFTAQAV